MRAASRSVQHQTTSLAQVEQAVELEPRAPSCCAMNRTLTLTTGAKQKSSSTNIITTIAIHSESRLKHYNNNSYIERELIEITELYRARQRLMTKRARDNDSELLPATSAKKLREDTCATIASSSSSFTSSDNGDTLEVDVVVAQEQQQVQNFDNWSLISTDVFQQQICSFLTPSELFSKIALLNKSHYDMILSRETWLHAKIYLTLKDMKQLMIQNIWNQCQFRNVFISFISNSWREEQEESDCQLTDMNNMIDLQIASNRKMKLSSFNRLLNDSAASLERLTLLFLVLRDADESEPFEFSQPFSKLRYLRVSRLYTFARVSQQESRPFIPRVLVPIVQNAPNLRVLDLSRDSKSTQLDNEVANILWNKCPLLEEFHICNMEMVEDSFFTQMKNCKNLRVLSIFLCPKLTANILNHISHDSILGSLQELSIRLTSARSNLDRFRGVDHAMVHQPVLFKGNEHSGFRKLRSFFVDFALYNMMISNQLLPPQAVPKKDYFVFAI